MVMSLDLQNVLRLYCPNLLLWEADEEAPMLADLMQVSRLCGNDEMGDIV